ncbi:hypothetical protein [Candidatus Nanosyncoccus alces]|uniref:Uncharacterized protein n=1 Tax=Candidatus Nanosyncoccus alces TaxID=2171997 RepID=A0ABY0FMC1_9BACT|nr:hypothetical protein [Candidatus Nanosyncoccus alces]RYC74424.1 hypothetical protein G3RUM_00578 [Candidatus Nanosyncoccus alces]
MEPDEFKYEMTCLLFALREFLPPKDYGHHFDFSSMFMTKGPYPSSSSAQKKPLYEYVEPSQITKLLEILQYKYRCFGFCEKTYFETPEKVLKAAFKQKKLSEYESEAELTSIVRKLSEQKRYPLVFSEQSKECLDDVFKEYTSSKTSDNSFFVLHIKERKGNPILCINNTPIRKFQANSYSYKMMKLALGLPNGSLVPVKDALNINRGDRGCSQDLSDVFKEPVLKSVFAREITCSDFRIYHKVILRSFG